MNELAVYLTTAYKLLKQRTTYKVDDWVDTNDGEVCKIERVYVDGIRTDGQNEYPASDDDPVYLCRVLEEEKSLYKPTNITRVKLEQQLTEYKTPSPADEVREEKSDNTVINFDTCTFFKSSAMDKLYMYGIYSSHYIDSDRDILTSTSHERFTKGVNSGEYPYPDIRLAHIKVPVGVTEMVDYHKEGFAVFGGYIFKEWEEDVLKVVRGSKEAGIQLGLSHGFLKSSIEYDEEGYINKYVSYEVSVLPLFSRMVDGERMTSASNKYTALVA